MANTARANLIGYSGEDSGGSDYVQGADWANVDTAAGTTHTNSLVETALCSHTFQPGQLRNGSVIEFEAFVLVASAQSTDTLTLKAYLGTAALTTAIFSSAATDVATNDVWHVTGTIVIRDADASGTYVAVVKGSSAPAAEGTHTYRLEYTETASINFQTTALLLQIGADWSVAHADNQVASRLFNVRVS